MIRLMHQVQNDFIIILKIAKFRLGFDFLNVSGDGNA